MADRSSQFREKLFELITVLKLEMAIDALKMATNDEIEEKRLFKDDYIYSLMIESDKVPHMENLSLR